MSNANERRVVLLKEDSTDEWAEPNNVYRCAVYLAPESEGGFSATVPMLPGAASQGETEDEAVANITEALEGLIETYKESGSIPWRAGDLPKPDADTLVRWVFVNG